jgi:hypothetical protein
MTDVNLFNSFTIGFGADPFERLSYATLMEDIKEELNRIEEPLKKPSLNNRLGWSGDRRPSHRAGSIR